MQVDLTQKKINIGLVGGGGIASNHLKAINHHSDDLNLVAVCDTNKAALNSLSLDKNTKRFNDYLEMIEMESLDVVSICTPSGLHPEQAILASNKLLHVITEKPMSILLKDGRHMVSVAKKNSTKLFVVKQNRYNKYVSLLKEVLKNNTLGKIHLVQSNVFWTRPQSYYDEAKWRGTKKNDGGALMNQASHYVDLLYWLFGPIVSLSALTSTTRNIETEDTGVVNLKFLSGALGTMNYSMLTYPKNYEGSITVLGEKGTVKIGGPALSSFEVWDLEDESFNEKAEDLNQAQDYDKANGHKEYYGNVISTLRGEGKPICDGEEGLKSLEILEATYLSSLSGQLINIPLEI